MSAATESDIAIVGMSGRFPGAPTLDRFWQNLSQGVESITRFSDDQLLAAGVPASWIEDSRYVKAAPILDDPAAFDAQFFRFSPEESTTMDPQHRILLELAYEALEDAGYDPERYAGRIGVFTGAALNTYLLNNGIGDRLAEDYIPTLIGADKDFLSTRIAYKLNLRGPSVTIQTACSTSMVAVHLARQSLLCHETDMVLAGGISVRVPHRAGYFFDGGGVVSPDGRVRTFDATANGTVFGSGGGVLVLKRLEDAVSDGDTIHAVIKGSAVNNDGAEKVGYTAPSVNGQAEAVVEALANAGVEADSISYVEAHGAGTPMGDPVEIRALTKAFRTFTQRSGYCAIGSVKTNVGHLDAAAAITGIIKTVLALKNRKIPASLNFNQPNPEIDFAETPFYVNTKLREWTSVGARRAGVMSTGMGGTNAHLILEEASVAETQDDSQRPQLLVLSANTESALDQATDRLQAFLNSNPSLNMADIAYTLQAGRKAFPYKRYAVVAGREDAIAALGRRDSREVFSRRADASTPHPVIMLLPGVGDQYIGMAHELYQECEVFRTELDRCAQILAPHLGTDIRKVLYPEDQGWKRESSREGIDLKKLLGRERAAAANDTDGAALNRTRFVQPALFAVEYALVRLWASIGVTPDLIVGHSMGEYVAACLAGVFSLEDALRLVATRAKLVDELPQGRMLAVMLSEQELLPLLTGDLSIALINGPRLCVVAGSPNHVDLFEADLKRAGVVCRNVQNGHAFHSRMLGPVAGSFEAEVRKVQRNQPKIPFISNVTGKWITSGEATDPAYWARHVCHPARFNDALHELSQVKDAMFLEAGPGRTLSVLAMQHPTQKNAGAPLAVSSLRHSYENRSDVELLWHSIGKLWLSGAAIKWEGIARTGRRISLPTYPFERNKYWLEADRAGESPAQSLARKNSGLDNSFYAPTWDRTTSLSQGKNAAHLEGPYWVVISDRAGQGAGIQAKLDQLRIPAAFVRFGQKFAQRKNDLFELNADVPGDYLELFRVLKARLPRALHIIHLGSFSRSSRLPASSEVASLQKFSFYSLLFMSQAIAELGITIAIKIGVISSRLHQVTGEEILDPTMATVLGPCGVIPREFSNISCFNVDLPASCGIDQLPSEVLNAILSEFSDKRRRRTVAYRGRYRWERAYRKVELPKPPSSRAGSALRHRGVYLITGATGGIGLAVAKHLAQTCQPKLVLTKKTAFPEKAKWRELQKSGELAGSAQKTLEKLLEIEELGSEVEVITAEASDRAQMKAALDHAVERFGAIHGVIHAAGVLRVGPIHSLTKEAAEKSLAPKVYGTMILVDLLKKLKNPNLDFLILFSSIASVISPYGDSDYCAANSFLDGFASFLNTQNSFHTVTVNWPVWKEVGRMAEIEALVGGEEDVLKNAISTSDGLEAFQRVLNSDLSQVIVSPDRLEEVLRDSETFDPATCSVPADKVVEDASGAIESATGQPTNEVEAKLAKIWSGAFGIEHVGIDENFFEIGGHSLLAARIVSQVERAFGKRLSIASIFRAPTIAQLAAIVGGAPAAHVIPFRGRILQPNSLLWFGGYAIFNPLARHLKDEPAMVYFTLPDESLATLTSPYTLEDVAQSMAQKVLEMQPEGPYFLGGWCLSGLLAYETAHQLQLRGKGKSLVILVDTPMPTRASDSSFSQRIRLRLKREWFHLGRLWNMPREHRSGYLRERWETLKLLLQYRRWRTAYPEAADDRRHDQILDEILYLGSLNYRPSCFSGSLLFLQPQLRPPDPYWDLAPDWGGLVEHFDVFQVPGDHTSLFREPNVALLAERIRLAIRHMQSLDNVPQSAADSLVEASEAVK